MTLTEHMKEYGRQTEWDFSDLRALFINCTLKRSAETSHTQGLMDLARAIMETQNVASLFARLLDPADPLFRPADETGRFGMDVLVHEAPIGPPRDHHPVAAAATSDHLRSRE